MKNMAAWLTGIQKIELSEIDMPIPESTEVIVKIEYVGICGSDMHFYETKNYSLGPIVDPLIPGHECAGVVSAIGADVTNLKIGDRVAIEPGQSCGECEFCKSGRYNICPNVRFISVPPYNGALRNYLAHHASLCFRLPDNVSTMEGALIEPLAVGLHAARIGGAELGKTVVLLGAGCIGLTTLMACKMMGVSTIIITDLFDSRLEKAKELGADITINASREDVPAKIMELTNDMGADIVFETAGSSATAAMTAAVAKRGGVIVMVGNVFGETPFRFFDIARKEIEIRTVYRYRNIYPLALQLLASGRININKLVTSIFDFKDSDQAFAHAISNKQDTIKSVIRL